MGININEFYKAETTAREILEYCGDKQRFDNQRQKWVPNIRDIEAIIQKHYPEEAPTKRK